MTTPYTGPIAEASEILRRWVRQTLPWARSPNRCILYDEDERLVLEFVMPPLQPPPDPWGAPPEPPGG